MSKNWHNPYNFRCPVRKTSDFVGRSIELDKLKQMSPNSTIVYGEHRIGLTSFLLHVKNISKEWQSFRGFHSIYIDLREVEPRTDETLFLYLIRSAISELSANSRKTAISNPLPNGVLSMNSFSSLKGMNYLFLLDEMDVLLEFENPHRTLGRLFNLASMQDPKFCFIFGCSNYLDIIEQANALSFWDSLYSICFPTIKLGVFTLSEAIHFLEQSSEESEINLCDMKDFLFDLAGTHPMFLQMACFHATDQCRLLSKKKCFPKASIERAFIEDATQIYENFWRSLSERQQFLLSRLGLGEVTEKDLLYDIDCTKLLDSGYIIRNDNNKTKFFSGYFAKYIHNKLFSNQENIYFKEHHTMLNNFLSDTVSLMKKTGETYNDIKASVQSDVIFIADTTLPIEEGDRIERLLPSGLRETFLVLDRGYCAGKGNIKSHYQIKVKNESVAETNPSIQNVIYNLHGQNSRINIHSVDNSNNIISVDQDKLYADLRQVIAENVNNKTEREEFLKKITELEQVTGTKSFQEKYKEFMALAANHMTIIAPFLPALAQMLS